MHNIFKSLTPFFVFNASDSRKYEHLYLRGNFQLDMFYDKVDMINVWNRIWLSAKATGVQILSVGILNNHFHLTVILRDDKQRTNFKHHLRLSITQYHNNRYKVHGTLGTRNLKHASLKDQYDIKDCICYHIRNILHHNISKDFINYPFSTARYVFNLATNRQKGIYTTKTLPCRLEAYLPAREHLPKGWMMTEDGFIVPPSEVFRSDIVESLFNNSREQYLESLSNITMRESTDHEEPEIRIYASDSRKIQDEQISEFVKDNFDLPIPSLNATQKMEAIFKIVEKHPKISIKQLSRLFGIPYTTLMFRLRNILLAERSKYAGQK